MEYIGFGHYVVQQRLCSEKGVVGGSGSQCVEGVQRGFCTGGGERHNEGEGEQQDFLHGFLSFSFGRCRRWVCAPDDLDYTGTVFFMVAF
ncbi:MAG: hypothetical protein QM271_04965 [Bacillota bacterium]|nr:hypothetical protein [Bacillota bacterium]